MTADPVPGAMRDLGGRLAALREAAGHTQASLARMVGYSRSTVANAEAGQGAARHFWEMCDQVLGAAGLTGQFDKLKALRRQRQEDTAEVKRRRREAEARQWARDSARPDVSEIPSPAPEASAATGTAAQRHLSSWAAFAPTLEHHLVERSAELGTLVSLATGALEPATSNAVAVVGPGGFGKTTLAAQACRDPQITGLFPEILWAETGEHCTPARVVQLISDLCSHLGGQRPPFASPEQAGFHLARVLADRRALLVIDNVWSAADLAPFLLGAPNVVRLVTTRNARVCPADTAQLRLGPMSEAEVRELLHRTVPALRPEDALSLAGQCNGWPLLASVVGSALGQDVAAGARADQAASDVTRALDAFGPPAFDIWDTDQRKTAIGHAITASLSSLEDHVRITCGPGLRDRYLSLAIFPAATPTRCPC